MDNSIEKDYGDSMLSKYQLQTAVAGDRLNLPEEIIHGAVAATVDAAASMWNTLTPEKLNYTTEDLLSRIDGDALQVYSEHPDLIHAVSFTAGSLLPIGLTMKGMTALRTGSKAVSWFSKAGEVSRLAAVEEAFVDSVGSSKILAQAERAVYGAMAANVLVDNVAITAALVGTMGAHPYMEDFKKDPVSNFLIWTAFGAGLGGLVEGIGARTAIRTVKGNIEIGAMKHLAEGTVAVPASLNVGNQLLKKTQNVKNWENALAKAASSAPEDIEFTLNPFDKGVLDYAIQKEKADILTIFEGISSEELAKAPTTLKTAISDMIGNDLRFAYVDKIGFASIEEMTLPAPGTKKGFLQGVMSLLETKTSAKTGKALAPTASDAVYLPIYKTFTSLSESQDYLTVADAGKSLTQLKETNASFNHPRADKGLEREFLSTGLTEADDIQAFFHVDSLKSIEEINKIAVHPDDIGMLQAVISKLGKLPEGEAGKLNLTITKEPPSYGVRQLAALKGAGFSPTYLKKLQQLDETRMSFAAVDSHGSIRSAMKKLDPTLGDHSAELLSNWLYGNGQLLRNEAVDFLAIAEEHGSFGSGAPGGILGMMNSKSTTALKDSLRPYADAEGNILLYRGMRNAPKGHSVVESYSLSPQKASHFAAGNPEGLRLYKIHLDDILASIEDYGAYGGKSNSEILVLNRVTRESAVIPLYDLNALPSKFFGAGGELTIPSVIETGLPSGKVDSRGLLDALVTARENLEDSLMKLGYTEESIALRLGIPLDAYQANGISSLIKYTNEPDIIQALGMENRALQLSTNLNKVPYTNIRSNLNDTVLERMNADLIGMYTKSSSDETVRGIGELFDSESSRLLLDYLSQSLSQVTVSGLKSTMARSANSVVENFGVAGSITTRLGQDLSHFINTTREKIVAPLATQMGIISKNEALIVETNLALAVNSSLSGKVLYKNGQFFIKELGADGKSIWVAAKYHGKEFTIVSQEVKDLFEKLQSAGRTMYSLNNTKNKVLGTTPITDRGFWTPAFNPRNKERAYVIDPVNGTSILWAKTSGELGDKVKAYEAMAKADGRNVTVVSKDQGLAHYNKIVGREEPEALQFADIAMFHSGSSTPALIPTNMELMIDLVNSYDHYINKGITQLAELQLSPIIDRLNLISELSQRGHNVKSMGIVQQGTKAMKDPGAVMKNILLNKGQLSQNEAWASWQQSTQVYTDIALENLSKITTPIFQKIGTSADRDMASFERMNKELESKGLLFFKAPEEFLRYKNEGRMVSENLTPRTIALSNSLAATMLLKFAELAQSFVNMISLPILESGALRRINAKNYMGTALNEDAHFGLISSIYDGIRLAGHPIEGPRLSALAEQRGLFNPIVSEANTALSHIRSVEPGAITKAENFLKSNFVENASFAANWSETKVRQATFFQGYALAQKAYPGLHETGLMTYARGFMDEAIGNYTAAQRPAFFQGTFGVAMGLFQTYMLTLAQQIYRGIEYRDWIGLSKQMFAQSAIFGVSSLPGFHQLSEQIGTHFSDNHIDLETGTFRAIGDRNATLLLYGLPSSLGLGTTTRGDIQPRIPNPIQGVDSLAVVNMTKQGWKLGQNLAKAATQTDENTFRAVMQALSIQSISRPVARLSELVTGQSITAQGRIIENSPEVYTGLGILARVMSTRPIEEIKAREAMNLDSVYKGVEGDKRRALIKQLRTSISKGSLNAAKIQELQYEYLRVGTPTGWRQAVNNALRESVRSGDQNVKMHLAPDAPYQKMIDDL